MGQPQHDLAEIKAKAATALRDPGALVKWNFENSVETVSNRLDLSFDEAMQFILEEICALDAACFCEPKDYGGDVYSHRARTCDWYVKLALIGIAKQLYVMSFHPQTGRLRPAVVRVRIGGE